jgi:putative membrane protein
MEILDLLWGTILLRPYVFVFFAVYFTIATLNMGVFRSLCFTVLAYSIAYLSEFSSTRNGFPYGFYSYIDVTRDQEIWIINVPFMDSLSYSFLSYVSLTMSLLFWSNLSGEGSNIRIVEDKQIFKSWRVILTGAILFMLMDVIIDPVAFRGDQWFLGKIYTYQEEGEYFNIPLTNFAGWFIVGTTILYSFSRLDDFLERTLSLKRGGYEAPFKPYLGPALYIGVLIFNLAVTFYIGEILLGICGMVVFSTIAVFFYQKLKESSIKFPRAQSNIPKKNNRF